eukprot:1145121-Amphidinium_carterae.1
MNYVLGFALRSWCSWQTQVTYEAAPPADFEAAMAHILTANTDTLGHVESDVLQRKGDIMSCNAPKDKYSM